jgi:hypothetical protein
VTCYYFYLRDENFGPAFLKACACFPYLATVVFDAPRRARWFFEALTGGNLGIGRPENDPPRHSGHLPHRDRPARQDVRVDGAHSARLLAEALGEQISGTGATIHS